MTERSGPSRSQQDSVLSAVWRLSAEDESEIASLAALCQAQSQQRECLDDDPLTYDKEAFDSDDEEDLNSNGAIDHVASLSDISTHRLKEWFLDSLAEVLAREKRASYVTCTSLIEREDELNVFVIRNEPWTDVDIEFVGKLTDVLQNVASRDSPREDSDRLNDIRRIVARHYSPRLELYARKILQELRTASPLRRLDECCRDLLSKVDSPAEFVQKVEVIHQALDSVNWDVGLSPIPRQTKLKRLLAFATKPEFMAACLLSIAQQLPGCQSIRIHLIAGCEPKKVEPHGMVSQYRSILPVGERRILDELLSNDRWVHAEIGMIAHLEDSGNLSQAFPYVGISKKTCFLCGHTIKLLSNFGTRGNHGKVYSQWTLPVTVDIMPERSAYWDRLPVELKSLLHQELDNRPPKKLDLVRESTVDAPVACEMGQVADPRLRAREAEWWGAKIRSTVGARRINTSTQSSLGETRLCSANLFQVNQAYTPVEEEDQQVMAANGIVGVKPQPDLVVRSPPCSYCGTALQGFVTCPRCPDVKYCDSSCRASGFAKHKFKCNLGRPIDVVDEFIEACRTEEYPENEDLVKAFGFYSFASAFDRQILFRLYCGVIGRAKASEDEVRSAHSRNRLKEFLLARGSQVPWAVAMTDLDWLRRQTSLQVDAADASADIFDSGCELLSDEDAKLHPSQLTPVAKKRFFILYCQLKNGFVPDVEEDSWINCGFCVARSERDTNVIASLYCRLIEFFTLDEIWKAAELGTLAQLFSKAGVSRLLDSIHNLRRVLDASDGWHESVWELKRFIRSAQRDPPRTIIIDYGLENASGPHERIQIRSVYQKFFDTGRDEMELHRACISGQLSACLRFELEEVGLTSNMLYNPYPLSPCPPWAGMVTEAVAMCIEADRPKVEAHLQSEGSTRTIVTMRDDADEDIMDHIRQFSAAHGGHVFKSTSSGMTTYSMRSY